MQVLVDVPDDLAGHLVPLGQDAARSILEDAAIQAYRENRLTSAQLMKALNIETRYELDGILKSHQVWIEYTPEMMAADQKYQDEFVAEYLKKSR